MATLLFLSKRQNLLTNMENIGYLYATGKNL